MEKFRNRFRISSSRLNSWNYGWNGEYFVTVCTKARINYFGNIVDDEMNFNSIGYWATLCWREIPHHFPFVKLGAFVVMPNHMHGIIIIDKIPEGV
jgi:putative transposase